MQTTKQYKKLNIIVFAFPGMGKTTYALQHPQVVDLDFGNFRSALKVKKEDEAQLILPFSRLMKYYFRDGFTILCNEPSLIPLVKQFAEGRIYMVLPRSKVDLVERVKQRAQQSNYHDKGFADLMEKNIESWVSDWEQMAYKYNIPIDYDEFLGVHYYE